MRDDMYLIIHTNSYTGNFERELMAYVFGIDDCDRYAEEELDLFRRETEDYDNVEYFADDILNNFDASRRGRMYSEYHGYFIHSHPENAAYKCDSIYIAVNDKFSDATMKHIMERLEAFTKREKDLQIINVSYFKEKYERVS